MAGEQGNGDYSNSILQDRLQEFGLYEVNVTRDGNCFFHAMAFNLAGLMSAHDSVDLKSRLADIGIVGTMTKQEMADHLRRLMVKEWRERHHEYDHFLPENVNYAAEVLKFERLGFFTSPLGDLMPEAMSNVLGMSLRIVSSNPNTPVLYVGQSADNSSPVLITLAYNAFGPGHYNAATSKPPSLHQIQQEHTDNMEHAGTVCGCSS